MTMYDYKKIFPIFQSTTDHKLSGGQVSYPSTNWAESDPLTVHLECQGSKQRSASLCYDPIIYFPGSWFGSLRAKASPGPTPLDT